MIETPFRQPAGTPIQPSRAGGARGVARVGARLAAGLKDLEGFERVWLLYWLHEAPPGQLRVRPFLDRMERGIFATRAPARPCPIGMSAVRLLRIEGNRLEFEGAEMIDGTPLLDIKPYVPEFDSHPESRAGWFDGSRSRRKRADHRFEREA